MIVKKGDRRFHVEVSNVTEDEYTIKCVESTAREDIAIVSIIVALGLIAFLIAGSFIKDKGNLEVVMALITIMIGVALVMFLCVTIDRKPFSYSETFKINGRLSESEVEKSVDKVLTNAIEMQREKENKVEVRENSIKAINEAIKRVRRHKKDK